MKIKKQHVPTALLMKAFEDAEPVLLKLVGRKRYSTAEFLALSWFCKWSAQLRPYLGDLVLPAPKMRPAKTVSHG